MKTIDLRTPCGDIVGIDKGDYAEFRGIRYAEANRFEYPREIKFWNGKYNATEFGECTYQRRAFENDEDCNAFYHKEFRKGLTFTYSEDSLYLNIYAPKNAENCPVIIYIHGGSFTGGSANEGHISGEALTKEGIIFIAFNYRLNAFGFCSHPDAAYDGACGNFGLYDQLAAISWVRNNISAFGGDAGKITLIGQSAGAMSVDLLISSPLCRNWFSGAVMMSGGGIQRLIARPVNPEKTREFWDKIISNAGVGSIEKLKTVDEKTLFYAWSDACRDEKMSMLYTLPVDDGRLVTKESFNMKTIPDIPIMLGVTQTDMAPIALEFITKKYAKASMKNKSGCYVYNFNHDLPGDNAGAWHSSDLLYMFGTLGKNWRPFEKLDYDLSHKMIKMISAFAKNGDPNCNALPKWDKGYKRPMRFCENTRHAPWETGKLLKNTFSNKGAEF